MMLRELSLLFAASSPEADYTELRWLVLDENVLLKKTASNRKEVFSRLVELYGLRREIQLYRALRDLWQANENERPMLAILCALARDPLLRVTAPVVLEQPEGSSVTPQMLEAQVVTVYPDRYSPIMLARIGQNTISSWAQSGHLSGRLKKIRRRAVSGPASTAYALLLGYLCGVCGVLLFETFWANVLDVSPGTLDAQAFAASQRGWIDYRRIGDVADVGFSFLMRP
jgi:hypothetical protein